MPMPPPTIAVTSTLAMVRTARARGAAVDDLLREAGVAVATLEDPDARLPAPTVLALWDALRARTGDPALQLAAPAALPFGAYRIIDYLVAASATVGDGVHRFARFFGLIADSLRLEVDEGPRECGLRLSRGDGGAVPGVYVDYVFAALVSRMRTRIRPGLVIRRLELRQPAPRDTTPHETAFLAPVRFGAAEDRLVLSAEEWAAPTADGDTALATLLEEHARILAAARAAARAPERPDFTDAARAAIVATLRHGGTAAQVARELNLSVRSLQRRLVECGTTFRALAEAVRGDLAQGYLADPRVSISEVAALLGFSEQSAFNRAFRRWTGRSPGQWRRAPG